MNKQKSDDLLAQWHKAAVAERILVDDRIAELERRVDVLFAMMEENVGFAKEMATFLKEMRDSIVASKQDSLDAHN